MKNISIISMAVLLIIIIGACLVKHYQAKDLAGSTAYGIVGYQTQTYAENNIVSDNTVTAEKTAVNKSTPAAPATTNTSTAKSTPDATTGANSSAGRSTPTATASANATGKAAPSSTDTSNSAGKSSPSPTATVDSAGKSSPSPTAIVGVEDTSTPDTEAISKSIIIDHNSIKLDLIPSEWIEKARKELHIAYGHTSHGSQIISGLLALTDFKKDPYIYKKGLPDSLDMRDNPFGAQMDLGSPSNKAWAAETKKYLANNNDINVVMWSWCGQLSKANNSYVKAYLDLMQALEKDFPKVTFVYMTGHLDGTGEDGTLARNNNQIREFCTGNNKVLYDFADIESYDPDGTYYGDKYANDLCAYDSDGDRKTDRNWAKEWQNTHKEGIDWYQCTAAHSHPINANMKAYAAWWLMARLAGWDGNTIDE